MATLSYDWENGATRPDVWTDEDWSVLARLVESSPVWHKVAYNPDLFGVTSRVLQVADHGLLLGATVTPEPPGARGSLRLDLRGSVITAWLGDLGKPLDGRSARLKQTVGPLPDSMETYRLLADFCVHGPFERNVTRRDGQLWVEVMVRLGEDVELSFVDLNNVTTGLSGAAGLLHDQERQEQGRVGGYPGLVDGFNLATLAVPRLPSQMREDLRTLGPWLWSTRANSNVDRMAEYLFETTWMDAPVEDFVTVSHGGHGMNSYALTLSIAFGPIVLMVQGAWGGAFGGSVDNGRLAELFADAAQIIGTVEKRAEPSLASPRRRPLKIISSHFRHELAVKRWDAARERYFDVDVPATEEPWQVVAELAATIEMTR